MDFVSTGNCRFGSYTLSVIIDILYSVKSMKQHTECCISDFLIVLVSIHINSNEFIETMSLKENDNELYSQ